MESEAVDVVDCAKLRVVVLQIGDVDDDVIDETIRTTATTLGARYAVHAVPVSPGTKYVSHVRVSLEADE